MNALRRMLRDNQYGTVNRTHFYDALGETVQFGGKLLLVHDLLEPWLLNGGVPAIRLDVNWTTAKVYLGQRDADENDYIEWLPQNRFVLRTCTRTLYFMRSTLAVRGNSSAGR